MVFGYNSHPLGVTTTCHRTVKKLYLPRGPTEPRKKNLTTFHYTGWLIRLLIMVDYNPYIIG